MSNPGKDQIRGWKEIASYFDRDERTVKRWEKQRALPVRRIPGEGRANVYIVISEAEAWLAGSRTAEEQAAVADTPSKPQAEASPAGPAPYDSGHAAASTQSRKGVLTLVLLLGAVVVVLVAGVVDWKYSPARSGARARSNAAKVYRSPQTKADVLYLQGVYFNEQRTPDDLERALDCFQRAIALDPGHARAYAGLAQTYLLLREYGTMPEAYAYFKAETAAQKALALDPDVPEAHASLGFIAFFSSWNSQQAAREFTTALRLDPNCVVARHWYGSMLTHQGMYPEALQQLDAAQRLEPTSAAILASKAYALGLAGRRDEAMDMVQPLVKADDAIASPHRVVATLSLLPPRDIPRFLSEMRRFAEIRKSQDTIDMMTYGADAFQRGGEREMWTAMLAKERELHPSADKPTYFMAETEAALGLNNEAIRDISILARQHDPAIIGIGIDPLLNPLRHNPGFQEIVVYVGLAPRLSSMGRPGTQNAAAASTRLTSCRAARRHRTVAA